MLFSQFILRKPKIYEKASREQEYKIKFIEITATQTKVEPH